VGAAIAEAGGELTPELEERLDALEGAFDAKVERIALLVQREAGIANMAKDEADRLSAIRKSHQSTADGLKGYLLNQMLRSDRLKVETPKARVRVQRNGMPSIQWTKDPEELPEAYKRVTVAPDLALVREELKAGAGVPEGFTVEYGHHLRIF